MSIVATVTTFVLLPTVGNLLNILETWRHMLNHMGSSINVHTTTTRTVTLGTLNHTYIPTQGMPPSRANCVMPVLSTVISWYDITPSVQKS